MTSLYAWASLYMIPAADTPTSVEAVLVESGTDDSDTAEGNGNDGIGSEGENDLDAG